MIRKLFVVTGPSGVGKSYLMQLLMLRFPEQFVIPRLLTTRPARRNESASDREFISQEKFDAIQEAGEFMFKGKFNNNWYGYTHDMIVPKDKHVLINAWPAMLPNFATQPEVVIIGMSVEPANILLLENRIRDRAESTDVFARRMKQVAVDLADLQVEVEIIQKHGKLFVVQDDSSADKIIDWVHYNYM